MQLSYNGQLIFDLLRGLNRISRSIKAKRAKAAIVPWVLNLSRQQLAHCFWEISQCEHWITVKDILLLHYVTSSCCPGNRYTPLIIFFNQIGRPQVSEGTTQSISYDFELTPDVYKLKYYEKELINSLYVSLNLSGSKGGDFSLENSIDLMDLMDFISDKNCFTRKPILFKGQLIVPWLQEMPKFTVGQYVVALIEKQLWSEHLRRADMTPANRPFSSQYEINCLSKEKTEIEKQKRSRSDKESGRHIITKALESFHHPQDSGSKIPEVLVIHSQKIKKMNMYSNFGDSINHELVGSFLDILKSKDNEKLFYMIGATHKRSNKVNSTKSMNFFKLCPEASKLWIICYLLDEQSMPCRIPSLCKVKRKTVIDLKSVKIKSVESTVPIDISHKVLEDSTNYSYRDFNCNTFHNNNINSSKKVKNMKNVNENVKKGEIVANNDEYDNDINIHTVITSIANSIMTIPLKYSLTPHHELKAILCKRLLTIGANCIANELIDDENMEKSSTNNKKTNNKKKKKNSKIKNNKIADLPLRSQNLAEKGGNEMIHVDERAKHYAGNAAKNNDNDKYRSNVDNNNNNDDDDDDDDDKNSEDVSNNIDCASSLLLPTISSSIKVCQELIESDPSMNSNAPVAAAYAHAKAPTNAAYAPANAAYAPAGAHAKAPANVAYATAANARAKALANVAKAHGKAPANANTDNANTHTRNANAAHAGNANAAHTGNANAAHANAAHAGNANAAHAGNANAHAASASPSSSSSSLNLTRLSHCPPNSDQLANPSFRLVYPSHINAVCEVGSNKDNREEIKRKIGNICNTDSNIEEKTGKSDEEYPYYKRSSSPHERKDSQEDSMQLNSEDSWGDENLFSQFNTYQKDKNIAELKNYNMEQFDRPQSGIGIAGEIGKIERETTKTIPDLHGYKNEKNGKDKDKTFEKEVEEVVNQRVEIKGDVIEENKSEVFGRWAFDDDPGTSRLFEIVCCY